MDAALAQARDIRNNKNPLRKFGVGLKFAAQRSCQATAIGLLI